MTQICRSAFASPIGLNLRYLVQSTWALATAQDASPEPKDAAIAGCSSGVRRVPHVGRREG